MEGTPASRKAALELLARARNSYALRSARQAYHLRISFAVDSQNQTDYDGAWEMEDLFVPGKGLHWTAQAAAGYSITGIASNGELYAEGTDSLIPFRLEEARGVLLHPLPSASFASRESIRTATVSFQGSQLTCLLLSSSSGKTAIPALGRSWEESEECIDPQSGLLRTHSEAPGRYAVYDYSNAPQLGGSMLPRSVTISEGGRIVSKISVEMLEEITLTDQNLFVPSDEMRARGRSIEMTAVEKISRVHGASTSGMTVRTVCVVGVVTPTGHLVEAHSLQPSDPNSRAAVEDARLVNYAPPATAGAPLRQHILFVMEKFVSK